MTETRKPRPRRTFSTFGDVRKMPTDYEIVTHAQNWTTRANRSSAFEQNPSSPANLWFLTYRDRSPLQVDDWELFRDPDRLTYKGYVNMQSEAEAKVHGVLEMHAEADADAALSPAAAALIAHLVTPSRYLCHGMQQVQAYIGYLAPTSYITNAAGFATADFLRRVTTVAYRTRELQMTRPETGAGSTERALWQTHAAWQPARRAIEYALISYDWAEAFVALDLVLAPTLDDVLLDQFGEIARRGGDELSWLLSRLLRADSVRRARWSRALAEFAITQRPANAEVLQRWVDRWAPRADAAARGLGELLAAVPGSGITADQVAARASAAREVLVGDVLSVIGTADAEGG